MTPSLFADVLQRLSAFALRRPGARPLGRVANLLTYLPLAVGVIACGLAASRKDKGGDFAPIHLTGVGVLDGSPIYDRAYQIQAFGTDYPPGLLPTGMFYPPSTGVAVLPFALLPFRIAQLCWWAVSVAVIAFGVSALLKTLRPEWGPQMWRLLAGAALFCSGVRWGLTPLQGAPLMFGLLCLFASALIKDNLRLAIGLAAFALAFKFTLAVPFLALLFLRRSYWGIGLCGALWLACNVLGMARVGGMVAWQDYRDSLHLVESFNDINTPDPWDPVSVPRIDLTYLVYGLTGWLHLAQAAAKGLAVLIGVALLLGAARAWKAPSVSQLAPYLLVATCLGSLIVYHHHYDMVVVLAPLLLFSLSRDTARVDGAQAWLLAPLWFMLLCLPIGQGHDLLIRWLGPSGCAVMNLSMPIAMLLGLVAGLRALWQELRAPSTVSAVGAT
jgi:hypothetical protein